MNPRIRVLFVSAHCPFGQTYGAQLRTLNIARILARSFDLGMALFPFAAIPDEILGRVREEFDLRGVYHLTVKSSNSVGARLKREFDPYSADTEGKRLGVADENEFMRLAGEYDVIWFQGVSIPNCLGRKDWPCAVLDIDDVPSQFYKGKVREADGSWMKLKATRKFAQWKWRETVLLERFGIVGVCSEKDRGYLGNDARIHVLPNGFTPPEVPCSYQPQDPPRIGFIGTMKYGPNREGIHWFISKVWPVIRSRCPDARLRLAGADTDKVDDLGREGIDRLGFVDDGDAEIASWSLTIVPILVGGGTRIKIAEAFSRMCPVVSTRQGAYGYHVVEGEECLLADDPEEFAGACLELLGDRSRAATMAANARLRFDREMSWDSIAPRIERAVRDCLHHGSVVVGGR